MKAYIMIGVPGSGKSTWGKTNAKDFIYCSADSYFIKNGEYQFDFTRLKQAHDSCVNKFKQAVDNKQNVIVDNTNTRLKEIRTYYDILVANNYEINLVFVNCDPDVAASRNVHSVPKEKVHEMYNRIKNLKIPDDWKVNIIKVGE